MQKAPTQDKALYCKSFKICPATGSQHHAAGRVQVERDKCMGGVVESVGVACS